jgi:hypothetical protein
LGKSQRLALNQRERARRNTKTHISGTINAQNQSRANTWKTSQTGKMTSNGQVINQRPPMTIANGVMTTARQSNDHKAPTDGQGDLRCEPTIQAGFAAG